MQIDMGGPRALIVDDDREVLKFLGEFVEREGFAASSAQAPTRARKARGP